MTPVAPILTTFDPLIAGMVGLKINSESGITQAAWYTSAVSGGPYTQVAVTYVHTGLDGLAVVIDATSSRFYVAKATDSTGTSPYSNEGQATSSAGPLSAQQELSAAIGQTVSVGDQVALYANPSTVMTVQPDGSLA